MTILDASARTLPVVDDEFAAMVRPGLTKESLESELRKAIDEEDSKEFVGARNKALSDALAEVVDVEVPDTIVTQQAKDKYAHMMAEMRDGGTSDAEIKKLITPENFQKYKDIVAPDIIRDFKISLATDSIAEKERIQVPADQIDEQMGALRKEAESSGEEYDEAAFRPKVESTMMRRFVFDFLADNAELDIVYTDDNEPEFDSALMEKLADESIAREQELVGTVAETSDESGKNSNLSNDTVTVEANQDVVETIDEPDIAAEALTEANAVTTRRQMLTERLASEAKIRSIQALKVSEAKSVVTRQQMLSERLASEARLREVQAQNAIVAFEANAVLTRERMMKNRLAGEASVRLIERAAKAEASAVAVRKAMMERRLADEKKTPFKPTLSSEELTMKYATLSEEDRAFNILVDLGIVSLTPDPDDASYDASKDDEYCPEYAT